MTRYWKVLNEDGTTYHHASRFRWYLPTKNPDGSWTPGKWMTPKAKADLIGPADLCSNRVLHICEDRHLVQWLGPAIFEVEVEGPVVVSDDKCGVRRARLLRRVEAWNERTARLFAIECAEEVLRLIPEPYQAICRNTLDVARRYANDEATAEELAAAGDAAGAAAGAAAWAAARAAAGAAAGAAAWDAARAAAGDAAEAAAEAAAQAAARAAAWDAAGAAAWAAARTAQSQRLIALLEEPA